MGTTDDSLLALNRLERTIKEQRALLLQAHGVLTCLYEVLLHGEGAEAVSYAQVAYVARDLVERTAEQVDSVRISPLLDALGSGHRVDESRVLPLI